MDKTIEEIIQGLTYFNKKFPRTELEQAIERKDEITPFLLSALDELNDDFSIAVENPDYMLHIYAMYLLAQFREKRAFEKLVKLVTNSSGDVDVVLGDMLTEDYGSILYSTYDGNVELLKKVIDDTGVCEYARAMAMRAYSKLYSEGLVSKDDFIAYLKDLAEVSIAIDDYIIGTSIVGVVLDQHLLEMIDDVQKLYETENVEIDMYGDYDRFMDRMNGYRHKTSYVKYIDDVIKAMQWWACFEREDNGKRKHGDEFEIEQVVKDLVEDVGKDVRQMQIITEIKIGRNDKCPCGSGKKYKKCCLDKETVSQE